MRAPRTVSLAFIRLLKASLPFALTRSLAFPDLTRYSRAKAVYPLPTLRRAKFWPTTSRLNDT